MKIYRNSVMDETEGYPYIQNCYKETVDSLIAK